MAVPEVRLRSEPEFGPLERDVPDLSVITNVTSGTYATGHHGKMGNVEATWRRAKMGPQWRIDSIRARRC